MFRCLILLMSLVVCSFVTLKGNSATAQSRSTSEARSTKEAWSTREEGESLIVDPCPGCKIKKGIELSCTRGSPLLNFSINREVFKPELEIKTNARGYLESDTIDIGVGQKIYSFALENQLSANDRSFFLEIPFNEPVISLLATGNKADLYFSGSKASLGLRGSSRALEKMRETCFPGEIPEELDTHKWTYVPSLYGQPHWITYNIPGTNNYVFGAFCEPGKDLINIELFKASTQKARNTPVYAYYKSFYLKENQLVSDIETGTEKILKGFVNKYGWHQTAVKPTHPLWSALFQSDLILFQLEGKEAGEIRNNRSKRRHRVGYRDIQKFIKACNLKLEVPTAEPQKEVTESTLVETGNSVMKKNRKLTLDTLMNLGDMPFLLRIELAALLKLTQLKASEVSCNSLGLGQAFKHLSGQRMPPFNCNPGQYKIRITAEPVMLDEKERPVEKENQFTSAVKLRFKNMGWHLRQNGK